jgi:hypothetical protein
VERQVEIALALVKKLKVTPENNNSESTTKNVVVGQAVDARTRHGYAGV